ncbi:hypothetical protein PFISCL1PPCAC_19566, partial [Pristionchus fissidentatus]
KFESNPTTCRHAFMIRRNIDPSRSEIFPKEMLEVLDKQGQEYFIVMASGGPGGPAIEFRLENHFLQPIFAVWHQNFKSYEAKKSRTKMKVVSYNFQTVNKYQFQAGLTVRVLNATISEDFCLFIHNRASMQHLCG